MAQGFAEAGVKGVAVFDYQEALGMMAAEKLKSDTGVDVKFVRVDVRDAMSVQDAVTTAFNHFGRIDVAINAAGIAE